MKSRKLIICLTVFLLVLGSSVNCFAAGNSVTKTFDGVRCTLTVDVSDDCVTVAGRTDEPIDKINIMAVADFINAKDRIKSVYSSDTTQCGVTVYRLPLEVISKGHGSATFVINGRSHSLNLTVWK